eukprot:scaffold52827_cov22-Cyclotella_meneghiniana.AAC.1
MKVQIRVGHLRYEYDGGEGVIISYRVLPTSHIRGGILSKPKTQGRQRHTNYLWNTRMQQPPRIQVQRTDWEGSKKDSPIEKICVL